MTDDKYSKAKKQRSQSKLFRVVICALAFVAAAVVWQNAAKRRQARDMKPLKIPVLRLPPVQPELMSLLVKEVEKLDAEVRRIKETGVIMETDEESLKATKKLQNATRRLLAARYGVNEPYRVNVVLEFQETIPDFDEKGAEGSILLEMAPTDLQPHSVFSFLEIARQWQGGAFHRKADHVLQVMVHGGFKHLAFQEYSEECEYDRLPACIAAVRTIF